MSEEPTEQEEKDDPFWNEDYVEVAKAFHAAYEHLAPEYGYETREASAVEWDAVPDKNKQLMIATVARLFELGLIEVVSNARIGVKTKAPMAPWLIEENERHARELALGLAAKNATAGWSPENIVEAAQKYREYLLGNTDS